MATIIHGRAALIINECQRGVVERGMSEFAGLADEVARRGILPRIAALAGRFRDAGLPVLHAPIAHRPDFADVLPNTLISVLARKHRKLVAGSEEAAFVEGLAPQPGDFVVERSSGMIAFQGTALDAILRRLDVRTVVLAGVSTNVAIAGCALAASDMGYHVVIPEDCIAGADAATHAVIVREQLRMIARIVSAEDLAAMLQTPGG